MIKLLLKIAKKNVRGYSLLGLIIILGITAIILASSLDTYHAEIVRNKEEEFIFRGEEMAKAVARFNNFGLLQPLRLGAPFPTKLSDLGKQVTLNGKKLVYVRQFALQDILNSSEEWRPLRAGDPLVYQYLQAWSSYYGLPIPPDYLQLAGVVGGSVVVNNGNPSGGGNGNNQNPDEDDDEDDDDEDEDDEDDDEDDDDEEDQGQDNNGNSGNIGTYSEDNNLFSNIDESRRPIVGVVSYSKGKAYKRFLGKDVTYDKWVFIYMPPTGGIIGAPVNPGNPSNPGNPANPNDPNNPNN